MFFTECERLAKQYPDLASAIQKIDAQFRQMRTAEVIRVGELASFLGLDPNQANAVLEGLTESGLLREEEMVECPGCEMAVLRSDYEKSLEEDDEYRCTNCDHLLKDGEVRAVSTYRRGDKWPELPPIAAQHERPETSGETAFRPILCLDEIKDGETNKRLLARIVGSGRFEGVNKKLGSRELFFICLLFKSKRTHDVDGESVTVVTADEATEEFLTWSKAGYLRFAGQDLDKPANRVQKMWHGFVRQIEKEKNLKRLFTDACRDQNGQRLYGLRLRPNEMQILVSNIPCLFEKASR